MFAFSLSLSLILVFVVSLFYTELDDDGDRRIILSHHSGLAETNSYTMHGVIARDDKTCGHNPSGTDDDSNCRPDLL